MIMKMRMHVRDSRVATGVVFAVKLCMKMNDGDCVV